MAKKNNRSTSSKSKSNNSSKKNKKPETTQSAKSEDGLESTPNASMNPPEAEKKGLDEEFEVLESKSSSKSPSKDNSSSEQTPRAASPASESQAPHPDPPSLPKESESTVSSSLQDSWQEIPCEEHAAELPAKEKTVSVSENSASDEDVSAALRLPSGGSLQLQVDVDDEQPTEPPSGPDKSPALEAFQPSSIPQERPLSTTPHSFLDRFDDKVMSAMPGYLFSQSELPTEGVVAKLPPNFLLSSDDQAESDSNTSPEMESGTAILDGTPQNEGDAERGAKEESLTPKANPSTLAENETKGMEAEREASDMVNPDPGADELEAISNETPTPSKADSSSKTVSTDPPSVMLVEDAESSDLLKDQSIPVLSEPLESDLATKTEQNDETTSTTNETEPTHATLSTGASENTKLTLDFEASAEKGALKSSGDASSQNLHAHPAKLNPHIEAQEELTDISKGSVPEEPSDNISNVYVQAPSIHPEPEVAAELEFTEEDKLDAITPDSSVLENPSEDTVDVSSQDIPVTSDKEASFIHPAREVVAEVELNEEGRYVDVSPAIPPKLWSLLYQATLIIPVDRKTSPKPKGTMLPLTNFQLKILRWL
ncbi:hypothetical protein DSO57_1031018 [Entomophthora muscae]|uniref:Uncharacterized protein n=1 Tax=Entomophthora muscae TaxID=34485 RepID=A0ACC2UA88_9FUNG|nr:hypothetical protein DSO57_1031018 [Entomophthora muscae]